MQLLKALIAAICEYIYERVNRSFRFFEQPKIMTLAIRKGGADDLLSLLIYHNLSL